MKLVIFLIIFLLFFVFVLFRNVRTHSRLARPLSNRRPAAIICIEMYFCRYKVIYTLARSVLQDVVDLLTLSSAKSHWQSVDDDDFVFISGMFFSILC